MNPDCGNYYEETRLRMRNPRTSCKTAEFSRRTINAVLKTLFLEQFPDNVRSILAIYEVIDLTRLAQLADKIFETSKTNIAQVNVDAKASSSENAIASDELMATINELTI